MNLHITHDDKFIDYFIDVAEELNVAQNKYVIYTLGQASELRHVKSKKVVFAKYDTVAFWDLIGDFNQYKNIFMHWMHGVPDEIVNKIPLNINVIWCFWGGDGLELPPLRKGVYQNITYKYFLKSKKNSLIDYTRLPILKKIARQLLNDKYHLKAIRRVNYFAHYLEEDYDIIKKATGFKAKYIPFHYAPTEAIVPKNTGLNNSSSGNILLGNSDSITNNHFEAINYLKQIPLGNRKVFCPLSYEYNEYVDTVAEYGKKILPENFIPIINFLPKAEYDIMLSGISVAIMNHNRSQAFGNIMGLLWIGAKIFMSMESSLYRFLKNNGFKIFTLQNDFVNNPSQALNDITIEEKTINRDLLLKIFGAALHKKKIKQLLTL